MANRRWTWALVVVGPTACGGDDAMTPSTSRLRGYWSHEEPFVQTVFAFVGADDVAASIDPEGLTLPTGVDLSAVHAGSPGVPRLDSVQIATCEVSGGMLRQTVIGDVAAPPGTMYETPILGLTADELTLASTQDPIGMRTYLGSARCPNENLAGWALAGASAPTDPTAHSPAIAIDAAGHVHSLLGSYSTAGDGFPRYAFIADGCTGVRATSASATPTGCARRGRSRSRSRSTAPAGSTASTARSTAPPRAPPRCRWGRGASSCWSRLPVTRASTRHARSTTATPSTAGAGTRWPTRPT